MAARAPPLQPAMRGGLETQDLKCGPASAADLIHAHAKFFFEDERIACPPLELTARLNMHVEPFQEISEWVKGGARNSKPGLIWLRSPSIVEPVQLSSDSKMMIWAKGSCFFELVPRISSNRSWWDSKSAQYLSGRPLRVRGKYDDVEKRHTFVCDSIWPVEWALPVGPLKNAEHVPPAAYPFLLATESHRLRMHVRSATLGVEPGGKVENSFFQQILWARELATQHRRQVPDATEGSAELTKPTKNSSLSSLDSLSRFAGKAVVAFLLNGAQGDDDESDGGHFAVATGRVGPSGQCSDWLVNNFYPLSFYSEKGILASPLPLDAYMTDLNAGQCWYRPSYMLVAVLSNDEAAHLVQGGFARIFAQQYRAKFEYNHAVMNCSGICVSVLRALGWELPTRGATSWLKAFLAALLISAHDLSLKSGLKTSDYLCQDNTRLFPAGAFEEVGAELLRMAAEGTRATGGALRRQLAAALEAVVFVRIPQIPSSRVTGTFPIVSLTEHFERWPADPKQRQIIPCPDRPPLPKHLRDADLTRRELRRSDGFLLAWVVIFGLAFGGAYHLYAGGALAPQLYKSIATCVGIMAPVWFFFGYL